VRSERIRRRFYQENAPSPDERDGIVRRTKIFVGTADKLERHYRLAYACSAVNTRSLAKAFRGELVPQDPNDETAWELYASAGKFG